MFKKGNAAFAYSGIGLHKKLDDRLFKGLYTTKKFYVYIILFLVEEVDRF